MTTRDKIALFWRIGGSWIGPFFFAAFILAIFEIGDHVNDAFDGFVLKLYVICTTGFAVYGLIKANHAFQAAVHGTRCDAEIIAVELKSRGDDGPDLYVLKWRDADNIVGQSLPAALPVFNRFKAGDKIVVYRHRNSASWWERDLFGPVVRTV